MGKNTSDSTAYIDACIEADSAVRREVGGVRRFEASLAALRYAVISDLARRGVVDAALAEALIADHEATLLDDLSVALDAEPSEDEIGEASKDWAERTRRNRAYLIEEGVLEYDPDEDAGLGIDPRSLPSRRSTAS